MSETEIIVLVNHNVPFLKPNDFPFVIIFSILILAYVIFYILSKVHIKFKAFANESISEFGDSPLERAKKQGISNELLKKIKRLQWLQIWQKRKLFASLMIILFFIWLITRELSISKYSYFMLGVMGLISQLLAGVFSIKSSLKTPYEIALESSTYYGYNMQIIKSKLETITDNVLVWFFLYLGFMLQLLSLFLSLFITQ